MQPSMQAGDRANSCNLRPIRVRAQVPSVRCRSDSFHERSYHILKPVMGTRQQRRNGRDLFRQGLSHTWDDPLKPAQISGFFQFDSLA